MSARPRCTCHEEAYAAGIQIADSELPFDTILTLSQKSCRTWKKVKKCPRGGCIQNNLPTLSATFAQLVNQLDSIVSTHYYYSSEPSDWASQPSGFSTGGSQVLPRMTLGSYQLDTSESQLLTGSLLRDTLKSMGKALYEIRQTAKDKHMSDEECPVEDTLARLLNLKELV